MSVNLPYKDNQEATLKEIRDLLKKIPKDQQLIGMWVGEDTRKIRHHLSILWAGLALVLLIALISMCVP